MTMKNPGRGSGLGNAAGGAARKGLTVWRDEDLM